jgi:hydroxymethylbilane synthase
VNAASHTVRLATRSSPLARWQADHVAAALRDGGAVADAPCVFVDTLGDRTQSLNTPLHQLGGQGVFVKEVQRAVTAGEADAAVHSAKDLPSLTPDGLTIAAFPARGAVHDVLIGSTLAALPDGARVGTGSVRRRAQLAAIRPDLRFEELRGNIGTRIDKLTSEGLDAIVLAFVPLIRLDLFGPLLARHGVQLLDTDTMLPMVGQGALAVECRADDAATASALASIDDRSTRRRLVAERAFLAELGSGCDLPVACLATEDGDDLVVDGLVAAPDGSRIVRRSLEMTIGASVDPADDPEVNEAAARLGRALASAVLAEGGRELLDGRA